MHTASTLARVTALAVGIAGVTAVGHVNAAAFQLKENSAKGLGRAFASSGSAGATPRSSRSTRPACASWKAPRSVAT